MPARKKNVNVNQPIQIKDYNTRDKYKNLKYVKNPALTKMYKNWHIKLDSFSTTRIKVSEYMEQVIDLNKFIDEQHASAWENEIYNLHLPDGMPDNVKEIKYDDVRTGKHLSRGDDSTGQKILLKTEKAYLSQVLNVRLMLDDAGEKVEDNVNLNWLVRREKEIIPALLQKSNKENWALATFDGYLKAIRHFLKLLLHENHELRIKYTMLYSDLDSVVQYLKGQNVSTGDDVIEMDELLKIVDILENRYKDLLKVDINKAFKANMDFLCVAVMVWDYPSRSDKYETKIVKDRSQATQKTTYLVDEDTRELYWIYRKDVKDIGRPFVVVPLEKQGLSGLQGRLIKSINESLRTFPREHLFINKNYNWKKNTGQKAPSTASTVSSWAKGVNTIDEVKKRYPKIVNKNLGINVFRRSFVTYWIDIMNNNEKRKLIHAMLTSFSKIDTYYKRKFNTVELKSQVKLEYKEPENYEAGRKVVIDDDDEPSPRKDAPPPPPEKPKRPMTNAERQRKYYMKHKEQEREDDKKRDKDPERKAMRVVRELNQGKKNFATMKPDTIKKYKIKEKKKGEYYFEPMN